MASKLTVEESEQLHRTVEMFEAITESQPDDYQSLEILKEAYLKLDRRADANRVARKLASVYARLGQVSQAILEYEGVLQESPNDPAIQAELARLEQQAARLEPSQGQRIAGTSHGTACPPTATASTSVKSTSSANLPKLVRPGQALSEVLIAERIVTPQAVEPLLTRLAAERDSAAERGQPLTLVQLLVQEQVAKLEDVLGAIVEKSGLPYMPLSFYDVDRDIACLLPRDLCLRFCVLPFDVISRAVLVATADPFCPETRNQVTAKLDKHIFWYVAAPQEITAVLQRVHGLDGSKSGGGR